MSLDSQQVTDIGSVYPRDWPGCCTTHPGGSMKLFLPVTFCVFLAVGSVGYAQQQPPPTQEQRNDAVMFRLSWKWRERPTVKITERTLEKRTEVLHRGREGRHPEAAFAGTTAGLEAM